MIPYIHISDFNLGPLPVHPYGLLVATGVLVGTSLTTRRARILGYNIEALHSFLTWMLVSAFVLSHMLGQVFYHWDELVRRPWSLLFLWEGLSSFGGFAGAIVGVLLWKYLEADHGVPRARPRPAAILPFADLVLSVLPIGWMFGRAGCATVHDHPGAHTTADTLLAVAYPVGPGDGPVTHLWFIQFIHGHDPRFDLGLLELLFTAVLAACFALTWRRRVAVGTYTVVTALAYAPVRFVLDFLRVPERQGGDTRYAGLTPAQYGCIALGIFGLSMIPYVRALRRRDIDPAGGAHAASSSKNAAALST